MIGVILSPHVSVPVAAVSVGKATWLIRALVENKVDNSLTCCAVVGAVVAVVGCLVKQKVDESTVTLANTATSG